MIASIELRRVPKTLSEFLTIIRPETLIRWHRSGFRCYWRAISGRPAADRGRAARIDSADGHGQPLYGAFVVKHKVRHTLLFPLAPGSCQRSSALMARQTPLLGRAFAVNPRSPKGRRKARGVDGESARRATMVSGHCMLQM